MSGLSPKCGSASCWAGAVLLAPADADSVGTAAVVLLLCAPGTPFLPILRGPLSPHGLGCIPSSSGQRPWSEG